MLFYSPSKRLANAFEFVQRGEPTQISFIERFNRTYRDEVLNNTCRNLREVREITDQLIRQYNEERPRDALEYLIPIE